MPAFDVKLNLSFFVPFLFSPLSAFFKALVAWPPLLIYSWVRKMFIGGLNWETTDRMYIPNTTSSIQAKYSVSNIMT